MFRFALQKHLLLLALLFSCSDGVLLDSGFKEDARSSPEEIYLEEKHLEGTHPEEIHLKETHLKGIHPEETRLEEIFTTELKDKKHGWGKEYMIVAAHPTATLAGSEVLAMGGTAMDAIIAAQMVLNVVEPQSSGIGGSGYLLYYDAAKGETSAYDGRETAPFSAHADMFLDAQDKPRDFWEASAGALAVGVPGLLDMLERAHKEHGALNWQELFTPAIRLAIDGFPISERLSRLIASDEFLPILSPDTGFFTASGQAKKAGDIYINKNLAESLRKISSAGSKVFYQGQMALEIIESLRNAKKDKALMSLSDLSSYVSYKKVPLCEKFLSYRVCVAPPSTSGGVTILQILSLLEKLGVGKQEFSEKMIVHLVTQAQRLAYADRAYYLGDPDFVYIPVSSLLSDEYLWGRAGLVNYDMDMGEAKAGDILSSSRDIGLEATDSAGNNASTTHISVIDKFGNVASLTSSIGNVFGSRITSGGFLLNGELTDFDFIGYREDGFGTANRAESGKRPRSSMSPVIVFDEGAEGAKGADGAKGAEGAVRLVIGSPGGSNIIAYVSRILVDVLALNKDLYVSLSAGNYGNRNGLTELESGVSGLRMLSEGLTLMGHEVYFRSMVSGLHGIYVDNNGIMIGAADIRREGIVLSERDR